MPNHLLFQAYTPQQVAQCRYFLLKYVALYNLKPPAATIPVVYTNQPDAFEGFTNFFARFQMPGLFAAAHPVAVTHLGKTELLHQFFLQHSGNVLYCNPDTYPVQPLELLFSDLARGSLYLHVPYRQRESELNAALRKGTAKKDKTATAVATPQSRINVYHAAVIGLSDANKEVVAKLAEEASSAPNNLALDYSYTRHFGEEGKLKSAGKYIFDYSTFTEFSLLLQTFFLKNEEESIPNQVKLVHHLDAAAIQQQKEAHQQQPLFKKWLQLLTGKKWSIRQYENKW